MRILLVSNYQPPHMGGIEFAAESLRKSWTRAGHQVTWLTTDIPRRARPSTPDNIRLPAVNLPERLWQINCPIILPPYRGTIRRLVENHDVVNTHSLAPGLASAAMRIAVRSGCPCVTTQHVGIIPLKSPRLTRLQEKVILNTARWCAVNSVPITFVGEAVRTWFARRAELPEEMLHMTPAGVDSSQFYFVTPEERAELRPKWHVSEKIFSVLFVGRFYEKKGLPLLHAVARSCPWIAFTFRGSGPLDPRLWNLPNVRVIDYLSPSELRGLYGVHDLLVMPSIGEGWPAVVPQAMACGVPCLISEETFAGYGRDPDRFLITTRNADVIAGHLNAAADGKLPLISKRREISEYALKTWNWDRTAAIYLELFEKALHT